ncbi:hypothetical protein BVC80_1039g20 [Macleaya cordata]|uniref:Uncharacterized protein n=1 Tax=Macleaya cordata TaxID=56857 RepID=A0A200QVU5_MACCD|nr:hypothetical protein BVC80_1039g20 [Macleaya cordata]
MVGPPPPLSGTKDSRIKRPTELIKVVRTPFQVRSEKSIEQQPQCPKSLTVSRRDAILSAVSLAAITLFSTDSAEARILNPEIKRKIFEKLKLLREKAGLPKPKSEDKKSAEEKQKSPPAEDKHKSPSAEEKQKSPSAEEKQKSPSAEDKHKSPSPQPSTTLPKGKTSEPPKQETPPSSAPQSSSKTGPVVEATLPK